MRHLEMLIDGHFVGGPCDYAVGKLVMNSPYDQTFVGTAAEGGWDDANAALNAAAEAFRERRLGNRPERRALLRRASERIRERRDELAELLVHEIGKPITLAEGEVDRLAITFDLAADAVETIAPQSVDLSHDPRGASYEAEIERMPLGVVLAIVPYNWPLNLAAHKVAPALAVGCPVVLKPSPQAPMSTLALARILHKVGAPPGTINAVVVENAVAERMVGDSRVAKVSFTGSPAVGWRLRDRFPRVPMTLELGGNASVIVEDGDPEGIAEMVVRSAFGYAGQICISTQHVWVQEARLPALREALIRATRACVFGDPRSRDVVCGPLISAEARERVEARLEEAVAAGARVLARSESRVGSDRPGLMAPVLVEGVPDEVSLAREEVFGPVLTLGGYSDFEAAPARVNRSDYGIHAGLFGVSAAQADRAFAELNVGGVILEDVPSVRFDALPYGGVKASGQGREGVIHAMDALTEWKTRIHRRS